MVFSLSVLLHGA